MSCGYGKIDLHMHSTVSDGTDTPEELLEKVKAEGIVIFSVTDHDAIRTAPILQGVLKQSDPRFIPGIEFSCKDELGKYHILGYGFDPAAASMCALVDRSHRIRMEKVLARVEGLKTQFGFSFPKEKVEKLLALDNPGKPHIGRMMIECGYVQSIPEAFEKYLNLIKVPKITPVRPEEAIAAILSGGGIPVLAHPFYGSGSELILGDDMEERLRRMIDFGLQGVEAYYSGFTDKLRGTMLALAKRYDLYITAGSDYHGANKLVKLGDTGLNERDEYPEGLLRFLRRFVDPCA